MKFFYFFLLLALSLKVSAMTYYALTGQMEGPETIHKIIAVVCCLFLYFGLCILWPWRDQE